MSAPEIRVLLDQTEPWSRRVEAAAELLDASPTWDVVCLCLRQGGLCAEMAATKIEVLFGAPLPRELVMKHWTYESDRTVRHDQGETRVAQVWRDPQDVPHDIELTIRRS